MRSREPRHLGRLLSGDIVGMKQELVDLSDHVWQRTRARVEGLTDEEYFWEPAPGCWTIRPRGDGTWTVGRAPPPP